MTKKIAKVSKIKEVYTVIDTESPGDYDTYTKEELIDKLKKTLLEELLEEDEIATNYLAERFLIFKGELNPVEVSVNFKTNIVLGDE